MNNENVDPKAQRERNERLAALLEYQIHNPSKFVSRSATIMTAAILFSLVGLLVAVIVRAILWALGIMP